MNTGVAEPAVIVERRCGIEEVFARSFIELLTLAPRNPIVRGLILAQTRRMPGPDCITFEQLQDWVELNCEKRLRPAGRRELTEGITLTVEFSETEYGLAHYSVPRSGSDEFHVGAEYLLQIVNDTLTSGGGLDEVVDLIADKIDRDAWRQCNPSLDDCGDYDYSDHDCTDSDNSETTCSKDEIRTAVLAFVRERHPELAAEL